MCSLWLAGTDTFRDAAVYPQAKRIPGIKVRRALLQAAEGRLADISTERLTALCKLRPLREQGEWRGEWCVWESLAW